MIVCYFLNYYKATNLILIENWNVFTKEELLEDLVGVL